MTKKTRAKARRKPRRAPVSLAKLPVAGRPVQSPSQSRGILRPVAKANGKISICGELGTDVKSAVISEQLASFGKGGLDININSEGGGVIDALVTYRAIRKHDGKKVARVNGLAASMASIILQAADERRMSRGSYVMIHNPSIGEMGGESTDLRRSADLLDKMQSDMLDIYESRNTAGLSRAQIKSMMDAETWMNAEEAVEKGFADFVDDDAEAKIEFRAVAKLNQEKIPAALRATMKGKKMDEEETQARIAALEEELAKLRGDVEEIEEEIGVETDEVASDDESEPEAEADEDEEKKEEGKAKAILALARRITGAKSLDEIEGKLMALGASNGVAARSQREAEVSALVKAGKLLPKDKTWALNASASAFKSYKNAMGEATVIPTGSFKPGKVERTDDVSEAEAKVARLMGKKSDTVAQARALKVVNGKVVS